MKLLAVPPTKLDVQAKNEQTNRIGYEKPQSKKNKGRQGNQSVCGGCGGSHVRSECRFRNAKCHQCGKTGHIRKVCRSAPTNQVEEIDGPAEHIDIVQQLSKIEIVGAVPSPGRQLLGVQIEGATVKMELDTGAPCSIMSKAQFERIKPKFKLQKADRRFASYTGHSIDCIGYTSVVVKIGATSKLLRLYIVDGDFDTLLGREWISEFVHEINFEKLFNTCSSVNQVTSSKQLTPDQDRQLNTLLSQYEDVFSDKAGKLTGPPAKMKLKPGATPVFSRARDVPVALRDAYAKEIDTKINSGYYKRVDYSEWASTTHIVAKKNGKLRITGNYKPTLNPRILIDEHPIPKVEHLFNKLRGASLFCHLDITDAYTHLEVDEEFSHALTLNTPTHGLIRPTRAVYGAANIPAIWQRHMDTVASAATALQ